MKKQQAQFPPDWEIKKLGNVCGIELGKTPSRSNRIYWDVQKATTNVW